MHFSLADVALDDQQYNTNYEDVTWESKQYAKLAERLRGICESAKDRLQQKEFY